MKNARRVILSIFGLMLFFGCAKPLIEAARDGQIKLVEDLLNKGADINEKTLYNGQTALMYAVENGSIDVVRVLLNKGADINVKNNDGKTVLRIAAEKGHLDIMKLLIEKGTDVNTKDNNGWIPLMWAAENGHLDIVKTLIDKGADINVKNNDGNTALRLATEKGHLDVMKLLIQKSTDINAKDNNGRTALMAAVYSGHLDIVKTLIEKGADVNAKGNNGWIPLVWAVSSGHADIVSALLERGADINAKGYREWTPLMYAVNNENIEMVRILINKGADMNAKGSYYNCGFFREGCEAGGWTALMFAAMKGNFKIVQLLLENSAFVKETDSEGNSAARLAEMHHHVALTELLKKAETGEFKVATPPPPKHEPQEAKIVEMPIEKASSNEKLPPPRKDAHALVIGIDYKGREGIPNLQYASQDAKKVYAALTDPRYGGVPKENATLLLNEKATRIEIMKALRRIKGLDGYVYLYYTGHGAPKTKGDKLEDGLLAPSDVDNSDAESLEESSIRMSYIQDILDTSSAKGVLVALDACFSGGGEKSIVAKGGKPLTLMPVSSELIKPKGTGKVIITSSATNQQSWEDDKELQGGIFSHYLLEGMKGKAGKDIWVNANELADYIKVNVPKAALNLKGADQTSQVIGHADFAVSRNWERSKVLDIEMAGAKLKAIFEKGVITTEQFNRAMDELKTPNRSKTLESFLEGKIDEKKFGTVY